MRREIHVQSDASEEANAAVAYLKRFLKEVTYTLERSTVKAACGNITALISFQNILWIYQFFVLPILDLKVYK